jgi:xylan 1,4-beta-xylosidase
VIFLKYCGRAINTSARRHLIRKLTRSLPFALLATVTLAAQQPVTISVDSSRPLGRFEPVWAWVGHDEPNYTYDKDGRSLLARLSHFGPSPFHDRTHNLLTSGDGTPALKWGSTNAFTRDLTGKPVYNWQIVDQIFDTYRATGTTPLVEIGFMPEKLSSHPEPYRHQWPKDFDTGWAFPPTNYEEWSSLVYAWVRHMTERYGAAQVAKWEWEVWNEPDIFYWHGTVDEYNKFYDYTVAAVKRALPNARVGGPATTGPASDRAAEFLRAFLEHCETGQNYATGDKGAPLDFISFHAKGKARYVNGHVELNLGANLRDIEKGFTIIDKFPALHQLPVILSESDPEGCAACDATSHPENGYRLTSQYASYEAELLQATLALAQRHHINLQGTVTWAFTFPGQPIFAGHRALTTRDVELPVLNAFRMFGRMDGERVAAESTGSLDIGDVLVSSVKTQSDVDAIATHGSHRISVLVWSYHDNSDSGPAEIHLTVKGVPPGWQVDQERSNAYTTWQRMGSPINPSADQLRQLRAAGKLALLKGPRSVNVRGDAIKLTFIEPGQGVSLLNFTW